LICLLFHRPLIFLWRQAAAHRRLGILTVLIRLLLLLEKVPEKEFVVLLLLGQQLLLLGELSFF
jgi:hypothetical protein